MDSICGTCLSPGRKLRPLGKLQYIYDLILPEEDGFDVPGVRVCWECSSQLRKVQQFRDKAMQAKNQLMAYNFFSGITINQPLTNPSLQSLSTLKTSNTIVNDNIEPIVEIKVEIEEYHPALDHVETEIDEEINEDIFLGDEKPIKLETLSKSNDKLKGVKKKITKNKPDYGKVIVMEQNVNATSGPSKIVKTDDKMDVDDNTEWTQDDVKKSVIISGFRVARDEADVPTDQEIIDYFQDSIKETRIQVKVMTLDEIYELRNKMKEFDAYKNANFKCENCIIGYETEKEMEAHKKLRHEPNRYSSLVCGVCLTVCSPQMYQFHFARHRVLYCCTVCQHMSNNDIHSHIKKYHPQKDVKTRLKIVKKMPVVKNEESKEKHKELRKVEAKDVVEQDEQEEQPVNKERLCQICGEVFYDKALFRMHVRVHTDVGRRCPRCHKVLTTARHYNSHLRTHERQDAISPVECEICLKVLSTKYTYVTHKKLQHGIGTEEEVAKCEECNIEFKTVIALQRHLKTSKQHLTPDSYRFVCSTCGRGFVYEFQMRDHENSVHKKLSMHACQHCSKTFTTAAGLCRHKRIVHRGFVPPKNKTCRECGRSFVNTSTLKQHMNTHTGQRPFVCATCGATFRNSGALHTHNRLIHLKMQRGVKGEPSSGNE